MDPRDAAEYETVTKVEVGEGPSWLEGEKKIALENKLAKYVSLDPLENAFSIDRVDRKALVSSLEKILKPDKGLAEAGPSGIVDFQVALHRLGFDPGKVDGIYAGIQQRDYLIAQREAGNLGENSLSNPALSMTQKATIAYQLSQGLKPTGYASKEMIKHMVAQFKEQEKVVLRKEEILKACSPPEGSETLSEKQFEKCLATGALDNPDQVFPSKTLEQEGEPRPATDSAIASD